MTKHEFLTFLDAAQDFFGTWPPPPTLYLNLRQNTPPGQARWDQQARPLIARLTRPAAVDAVLRIAARAAAADNRAPVTTPQELP